MDCKRLHAGGVRAGTSGSGALGDVVLGRRGALQRGQHRVLLPETGGGAAVTREQYERTEEALVSAIERAETPEAVIRLTELLTDWRRNPPTESE